MLSIGVLVLTAAEGRLRLPLSGGADPSHRIAACKGLRKYCRFIPLHAGERDLTDTLYRLVIAADHPLFRGALREAVTGAFGRTEIAEAGSFDEVSKLLDKGGEVDLILLDLSMPGVRGFSGLMYLRAQYPSVPVVVVSANDDPSVIRRCMDFGASGF